MAKQTASQRDKDRNLGKKTIKAKKDIQKQTKQKRKNYL